MASWCSSGARTEPAFISVSGVAPSMSSGPRCAVPSTAASSPRWAWSSAAAPITKRRAASSRGVREGTTKPGAVERDAARPWPFPRHSLRESETRPHSIRQPGCSGCKKKGAAAGTPTPAVAAPAAVFLFVLPPLPTCRGGHAKAEQRDVGTTPAVSDEGCGNSALHTDGRCTEKKVAAAVTVWTRRTRWRCSRPSIAPARRDKRRNRIPSQQHPARIAPVQPADARAGSSAVAFVRCAKPLTATSALRGTGTADCRGRRKPTSGPRERRWPPDYCGFSPRGRPGSRFA